MSFVPGGGLPVNVAIALATLVCLAFMLLPGLGIAFGLGRRADWSLATIAGAAFAFTMFGSGIVAMVAHFAGLSLTFALVTSAVLFAVLTAAALLLGRGGPRPGAGWQGFALAGFAALLAMFERPWFAFTADTFYHLAAVRSLLQFDRPMVTDPFYGTGLNVIDPTSGVWHTMLGMISRATGLDPMWVWPGATAVGAAMTALGFWVLAERVSRSDRAASVATLGLLVLPLMLDMRWFAYPNRMSLALIFLALAGVADLMDRSALADAALVVAAGFGAISLHMAAAAAIVIVAVFLGVLLIVAVIVDRVRTGRWELKPLAALALTGLVLAAITAAVLLPKADVVSASPLVTYQADEIASQTTALGPWRVARPAMFRDHGAVIVFSTLLGLLAAVPAFRRGDRRALATFGICVAPVFFFMNPPLTTLLLDRSLYLTSRIAILLRFPMYVGVAWGLGRVLAHPRAGAEAEPASRVERTPVFSLRAVPALTAAVALVVAGWIGYDPVRRLIESGPEEIYAFEKSRTADVRYTWGPDSVRQVWEAVGPGYPLVAGDLETTYYLAGVMPVAVMAAPYKHAPFPIEARDGEQRRSETETLLDPATPSAVREEILTRRGVDFVVINPRGKTLGEPLRALRAERELLEPVVDTPRIVLFRVKR